MKQNWRNCVSIILTCFIFLVLFSKEKDGFFEEDNPSKKIVIVEEELENIDINNIGNLEDSA